MEICEVKNFNPRSREGSDDMSVHKVRYHLNFNPRSREGSDLEDFVKSTIHNISIHAPARGATFDGNLEVIVNGYFNPRSREGSDCI